VDEQAFDLADKLAREPLAGGQPELTYDRAVLEQAALVLHARPHPIVFVIGIPPAPDRGAVGLAEVEHLVVGGMGDRIKGRL
jgi:hypothetical protein